MSERRVSIIYIYICIYFFLTLITLINYEKYRKKLAIVINEPLGAITTMVPRDDQDKARNEGTLFYIGISPFNICNEYLLRYSRENEVSYR